MTVYGTQTLIGFSKTSLVNIKGWKRVGEANINCSLLRPQSINWPTYININKIAYL